MKKTTKQFMNIVICFVLMSIGLLLFKFLPMQIWGQDILFDASMHIVIAMFALYTLWFFIDQNKSWRIPYFFFSIIVLTIISIQMILVQAHNDVGLLLGFAIGTVSIIISQGMRLIHKLRI